MYSHNSGFMLLMLYDILKIIFPKNGTSPPTLHCAFGPISVIVYADQTIIANYSMHICMMQHCNSSSALQIASQYSEY